MFSSEKTGSNLFLENEELRAQLLEEKALTEQLRTQLAELTEHRGCEDARAQTPAAWKLAQEALRQSEERYRLLAETMLQGVVHQDANGTILVMNPAAERILGRSPTEFLGSTSVAEEYHTLREDGSPFPGLEHPAMVALQTGRTLANVVMGIFNPRDRAYRWIRVSAVPIFRSGEDRPCEVYTVFEDITERKLTDEKIRRQSAILAGINEIFRQALVCKTYEDLGRTCLEIAERLTRSHFGFIGEINEDGLQDIAISNPGWEACSVSEPKGHGKDTKGLKIHGLYGRVLKDGRSVLTNEPTQHPDSIGLPAGHPPLTSFLGVPLMREGRTVGMIGLGNRDGGYRPEEQETALALAPAIVEAMSCRRAEDAVRESVERQRMTLEAARTGTFEVDLVTNEFSWSPMEFELMGLEPGAPLGDGVTFFDFVHPDDLCALKTQWEDATRTGVYDCEFRIVRADGQERWFAGKGQFVYEGSVDSKAGRWPVKFLGVNYDITERKHAEEAVRKANEQLREADRRKDEFLAMLAHELRNPLSPVLMAVEIMRLVGPRDPVLMRQRDVIERQVGHMAHLLDDLLDVSRITRGKIELKMQPLHLTDVLLHAMETAAPLIETHHHTLTVTQPPDPVCVRADLHRLSQAISNLLVNAAKFTDEGGQIWLSAAQEGTETVVRVRDNGPGIAPEMLAHVFELFTQDDRTLSRSKGGLGIGLTMVKNLVEMHDGKVEVFSEGMGLGCEFVIRLPSLPDRPERLIDAGQPDAENLIPVSRRVLVVDDIADSADSLAQMLSLSGHDVRAAHSGTTALQIAREFCPEVVLLDIGMPTIDGYEVARALRAEHGDSILLAALTGYAQPADREAARDAGFDHHLAKPVDLKALRDLLYKTSDHKT